MNLNKIKKLLNILKCPVFVKALFNGAAAGTEHACVLKNIQCDFVVDVGANRGQFALVARKMFPGSCIHSFEPLDEPAKIFENVFSDDANVHLHRCAIGAENATMSIHVSERDDSSSLLPIGKTSLNYFLILERVK